MMHSKFKISPDVIWAPALCTLIVWFLYETILDLVELPNVPIVFLYYSVLGTTILLNIARDKKDPLNWILISALLSFTIYDVAAQHLNPGLFQARVIFHSMIIAQGIIIYVWLMLRRISFSPGWVLPFSVLVAVCISVATSLFMLIVVQTSDAQFNMTRIIITYNLTLQSLIVLLTSLIFSYQFFLSSREILFTTKQLFITSGFLLLFLIYQARIYVYFLGEPDPWTIIFFRIMMFIPVLMWLVVILGGQRLALNLDKQTLITFQLILLIPIIFLFVPYSMTVDFRKVIGILASFLFCELVFFLYYGLLSYRYVLFQQNRIIGSLTDFLTMFWGNSYDGLLIVQSGGTIELSNTLMNQYMGHAISGQNLSRYLVFPNGKNITFSTELNNRDALLHTYAYGTIEVKLTTRFISGIDKVLHLIILRDMKHWELREQENRNLQEQIFHLEKMSSVSIMASGIAHNFNNLLCGIRGYSELILLNNSNPGLIDNYVSGILEEIKRAANLIQKVIKSAELESFPKEKIKVQACLKRGIARTQQLFNDKMTTFDIDIPENLPFIYGSETELEELFFNIILNGIEAMTEGGTITVKATTVHFDLTNPAPLGLKPGEYLLLCFKDQGAGIPEEFRAKIFDPFFTTKSNIGSGLGLTLAYSVVKRHNGAITFHRNKRKGVTFDIYFPTIADFKMNIHRATVIG